MGKQTTLTDQLSLKVLHVSRYWHPWSPIDCDICPNLPFGNTASRAIIGPMPLDFQIPCSSHSRKRPSAIATDQMDQQHQALIPNDWDQPTQFIQTHLI